MNILNTIDNKITFILDNATGKYSISSNFSYSVLSSSTILKIIGGVLNTTYTSVMDIHNKYNLNFPFAVN